VTGTEPAVSVLVAARDAAATLESALASVRRQTVTDWECVVADDGSSDATPRLLEAAAHADPRIRPLRLPAGGVVAARNAALAACRAPRVALLDADDRVHPRRLERQAAALDAHPAWAGVACHVRYAPRAALGNGMRAYETWLNSMRTPEDLRRERFVEMPAGHPSLLLRTATLRALGGWRDRGWPEDWDLFLRCYADAESGEPSPRAVIGVVPERLLAWNVRADSLSRTSPAYEQDAFTRCRAAHLAGQFLADADTYALWGYGGTGRALRRALADHGKYLEQVVELHPGRLGQRIHGAPVVPPEALGNDRPQRLIVSVAGAAARSKVRGALAAMGYVEERDYVCAA
jgi:glycosyltransferase involved in cell wall biosynthesis